MMWARAFLTFAVFSTGDIMVKAYHFVLDIECQANGDIIVQNPSIAIFKSMTAGTENIICNVTRSADYTTFTVSGCPKSEEVLISLSVREGDGSVGDPIMSGSYQETYSMRCQEIDAKGVFFNSSMTLSVGTNVSGKATSNETAALVGAPVTPKFTVISTIWNSAKTQTVKSANVGDVLIWGVEGPYEYDLLPYHCTVNPGSTLGTPPVVPVILKGCSVMDMVTNFVATSGTATEKGSLSSTLYAFKFHSSDEITIACSVKICTRGDAVCTVDCSRKRREFSSVETTDLAGTQASVVSYLTIKNVGTTTSGLSNILGVFVFVTALGLNRV